MLLGVKCYCSRSVLNEIFEVSNYVVTTIKERFQQIGYQVQLESHLIEMILINLDISGYILWSDLDTENLIESN